MRSISTGKKTETRHFMDDEQQLTIGIHKDLWPIVQRIANRTANEKQWLGGRGSDFDYLNIWIIGCVARCPKNVELHEWISQDAK